MRENAIAQAGLDLQAIKILNRKNHCCNLQVLELCKMMWENLLLKRRCRGQEERSNVKVCFFIVLVFQSDKKEKFQAANMIKNLSELNKDLLEVQKRKKDLVVEKSSNGVNVDKAVFVGSTAELMKLLKSNKA